MFRRHAETGSFVERPRRRRPQKTSRREDGLVEVLNEPHRFKMTSGVGAGY